jgi:signal transduction histidine kinase
LQPIVNEVSAKYPGYGLGYYHSKYKIVALAPYNENLIGAEAHPLSLRVYRTKAINVSEIDSGITRDGKPLLSLNYPLFVDGEMVGHVWGNVKTEDIDREFYIILTRNLSLTFGIWCLLIYTIRWGFRVIDRSLDAFSVQIQEDNIDKNRFKKFPQLIPVLELVGRLRENLRQEYETRAKINEELAKIDRLNLVSQMAAGVAHEVRNPMTVIMGYIQMMALKAEENAKHRYILILEELNKVNEIISDFLSLARNKNIEKCMYQINDLIEHLFPLLYADLVKNGIEIDLQLDETLPEIKCDKKEISQLILNLARNASEAMQEKGGVLMIKTSSLFGKVQLQISDNGCGIPEHLLNKIFDPFFTTKDEGTGLGLAVCRSIMDRHKGELIVKSTEGIGTTFIINFD